MSREQACAAKIAIKKKFTGIIKKCEILAVRLVCSTKNKCTFSSNENNENCVIGATMHDMMWP